MLKLRFISVFVSLMALTCLTGCQPSLNWRAIQMEGTQLRLDLPCKPDRTVKTVQMAGHAFELNVAGCEANDAVWAVMSTQLPASVNRSDVLNGWRQATLQNIKAQGADDRQWSIPKGSVLPGTLRLKAKGTGPHQQAVYLHAAWFAHVEGDAVRLVHMVVYQNTLAGFQNEAQTDPFFESVKLP
jgi:hypothetical protein